MSFRRKSCKNSVQNSEVCSLSPSTGGSHSSPPPPLSPQSSKSKKQNRKHKSKSLIVPPTTAFFSSDSTDCAGNGNVRSADADSPLLELRRRFSFRNFRRCRSVSKSRTNDSTSQSPTNELTPPPNNNNNVCSGEGSGRPTRTVASDTDCSDRCDTPISTSPLPSPAIRKFHSFVDICLFFTKLQRQLTLTTTNTTKSGTNLFNISENVCPSGRCQKNNILEPNTEHRAHERHARFR